MTGDISHGSTWKSHWSVHFFFFCALYPSASGQAVVTGVVPSPPPFLPSTFIAHRAQQSHCSSICHRVLLTHALALSARQFVHKNESQRIYTSMHSAGLVLTKLTYTRLEDNLIRHWSDRPVHAYVGRLDGFWLSHIPKDVVLVWCFVRFGTDCSSIVWCAREIRKRNRSPRE